MLSCVWLFATPWTVAPRLLCPWDSPGKSTGVGCHSLLQGNLPDSGIELVSPALQDFLPLSHQGSQKLYEVKLKQYLEVNASP